LGRSEAADQFGLVEALAVARADAPDAPADEIRLGERWLARVPGHPFDFVEKGMWSLLGWGYGKPRPCLDHEDALCGHRLQVTAQGRRRQLDAPI
jgi:hypothetical protein